MPNFPKTVCVSCSDGIAISYHLPGKMVDTDTMVVFKRLLDGHMDEVNGVIWIMYMQMRLVYLGIVFGRDIVDRSSCVVLFYVLCTK